MALQKLNHVRKNVETIVPFPLSEIADARKSARSRLAPYAASDSPGKRALQPADPLGERRCALGPKPRREHRIDEVEFELLELNRAGLDRSLVDPFRFAIDPPFDRHPPERSCRCVGGQP